MYSGAAKRRPAGFAASLRSWKQHVVHGSRDTKRIALYLGVVVAYVGAGLLVGLALDSPSLVVGSLRTFFDLAGLAFALIATIAARATPNNDEYAFGLERIEELAAFANALFPMFVALSSFMHGLESASGAGDHDHFEPSDLLPGAQAGTAAGAAAAAVLATSTAAGDALAGAGAHLAGVETHYKFRYSSVGLALFLFGLIMFKRHRRLPTFDDANTGYGMRGSGAHRDNMHGVFIHVAAHAVAASSVVLETAFSGTALGSLVDALLPFVVSVLIWNLISPLLKRSGRILLQMSPESPHMQLSVQGAINDIGKLDGVTRVRDRAFWALSSTQVVGSLRLAARPDASEQAILAQAYTRLRKWLGDELTVEVAKDES